MGAWLSSKFLSSFYRCTGAEKQDLQYVVESAQRTLRCSSPPLSDIYTTEQHASRETPPTLNMDSFCPALRLERVQ